MFFSKFNRSYTFSLVNRSGRRLTGNSQKVFFKNVEPFKDLVIKDIQAFRDGSLGPAASINFNGEFIFPASSSGQDYLNLFDEAGEIVIANFPMTNLIFGFPSFSNLQKTYSFHRKIDWYKSYVYRASDFTKWEINEGYLFRVTW